MDTIITPSLASSNRASAEIVRGVTEIAAAFMSKNQVAPSELPALLRAISQELTRAAVASGFAETQTPETNEMPEENAGEIDPRWANLSRAPVIPVEDSVTEDAIICLFDGVPKKMLKRYIRAKYGMEEADYKAWFGLPADYPMVAPGYAAQKAAVAIEQGLGSTIDKTPRHLRAAGGLAEAA